MAYGDMTRTLSPHRWCNKLGIHSELKIKKVYRKYMRSQSDIYI